MADDVWSDRPIDDTTGCSGCLYCSLQALLPAQTDVLSSDLYNKTNENKPLPSSSLMRTCCIIYTVHISWAHFSRTPDYFCFRTDSVVTQKRTGCHFGFHTYLMSLCLSLTLSQLWLLSYVNEPDDAWRMTGEVIIVLRCERWWPAAWTHTAHQTLNLRPASFFWCTCSLNWSSWVRVMGLLHSAMICPMDRELSLAGIEISWLTMRLREGATEVWVPLIFTLTWKRHKWEHTDKRWVCIFIYFLNYFQLCYYF